MAEEGFLIGVAQLGGTFAGFVAIFLIFVRQDGRFSPADALRIRALIYTSLLVVMAGLIPVMMFLVVGQDDVWRWSSALTLAIGVMALTDVARSHARMTKEQRREIVLIHAAVTYGLGIGATLLVAALALGFGEGGALYIVALMMTMANVAVTFITLAFKNLF